MRRCNFCRMKQLHSAPHEEHDKDCPEITKNYKAWDQGLMDGAIGKVMLSDNPTYELAFARGNIDAGDRKNVKLVEDDLEYQT